MEKLNQIIESMALAQFKADKDGNKMNDFILKHATLGEFVTFFQNKCSDRGTAWVHQYRHTKLGKLDGLGDTFCNEILWRRMKDSYIEDVVKSLENKLESTYKITIEQL